jgi:hypothetical protein
MMCAICFGELVPRGDMDFMSLYAHVCGWLYGCMYMYGYVK